MSMDATGNEIDVFQDDSPPIVDCDVLEAAKENIQPLASGRRVTALSAILKTPHLHREAKLAEARKRHRTNVSIALEDEEDDPLEAYCRFVYWTVENYPQGHSAESCLLELLEEATRVLKDDRGGIWKSELRYLKLWVLYASYVEKPSMIFKFCLANDVGEGHSLLYEEYANVLERMGKKNEADNIYLLGIARQAVPLERLKSRYAEFQKRMMISSTTIVAEQTLAVPSRRPVLVTTGTGPSPSLASGSSTQPRPNGSLQIFMDPDGSSARAEETGEESSSFPDIGTRKSRVKENTKEVNKMAGTTLKQAGKSKRLASAGSAPKFVPYKDPEQGEGDIGMPPPPVPASKSNESEAVPQTPSRRGFVPFRDADGGVILPSTPKFTPYRDEPTTPSSPQMPVPDSVMKLKWAGDKGSATTSEAEALKRDPFKNYDVGTRPLDSDD